MTLTYDQDGKKNWVTAIKLLLFSTGFHYVWYEQNVEFVPLFINTFTQRLKDIYQQKWFETISLSPKCHYYSIFKSHIFNGDSPV